jgi:hypothetical protein
MKGIHLPEIKSNGKTYRTNKLMFRSPDLRPSLLQKVDITEILLKRVKHHKPSPPPRKLIESLDVLCPKLFHIFIFFCTTAQSHLANLCREVL